MSLSTARTNPNSGLGAVCWKGYVTFRKIGVGNKVFDSIDAMHEDYINFVKAYIRYQHSLKPLKNYGVIMMALRCLEQALFAGSEHWSHL